MNQVIFTWAFLTKVQMHLLPQLIGQSSATSYSWSPAYNIINPNIANPIAFPKDTTVYTVTVKDFLRELLTCCGG